MKHYRIPRKELSAAVESIWFQESEVPSESLLLPSLHAEMMFNLGNKVVLSNPSNEVFSYQRQGAINGINTCPIQKRWEGGHLAFGVTFKPWGLFHLFGWDAMAFSRNVVAASTYFDEKSLPFSKGLFLGASIAERFTVLEEFLLKHSRMKAVPSELFTFIEDMQDAATIKEYLKINNIPHSTFNARFKKVMGVGIKQYLLIKRIQNTMEDITTNKSRSLTEIAYTHGFYDQAHFNKSFLSYTSMTPLGFKQAYK